MKNIKISLLVVLVAISQMGNAQDNAGLKLPTGFKATLFADTIGSARHIAITANGVLFAKLMYPNKTGNSIIRLEDQNNDGVADNIKGWAKYGGTGIFVQGKNLYATSDNDVYLYQLNEKDEVVNPLSPKTIVKGLLAKNQHASKSITLDGQNNVYVNIGAYVDEGTMVDTWATVGSCAQIGKQVHLSGGVGIGGVLEPLQASPVIIEDGCFIGSRCIVVEGVHVEKEAVLGANVVLTQSTKIIDVSGASPIEYKGRVPARSVVIPGSYTKSFPAGDYQVSCALIIGQRKASTDLKTSLNDALRDFNVAI